MPARGPCSLPGHCQPRDTILVMESARWVAPLRQALDMLGGDQVRLPQRTLAAMLGVQRPRSTTSSRTSERRGLISLGYASVTVDELQVLRDLADR
jgi:hypothetical protein